MFPSFKIQQFLEQNPNLPTPFLIVDTDIIIDKYKEFKDNFPTYDVFYAVKCNPAKEVLTILDKLGSYFDVASIEEIHLCLSLGIDAKKLSWGSPIKKAKLIKEAFSKGVDLFVFDSIEELEKIAKNAPGSKVYCRIMVNNENALWPLSGKFGCSLIMAEELLKKAQDLGLRPYGISFHAGSQQIDMSAWREAIRKAAVVYRKLKEKEGINLKMVNIGGGYPAYNYLTEHNNLKEYKKVISSAFVEFFPDDYQDLHIIAEPGRFLVADAGVIKTEVVLVSKKDSNEDIRWVYLDIGIFGGLAETIDESIKYKIMTSKDNSDKQGPVALAGPTCDGMDVIYKNYKYLMPLSLKAEDYIYIISTGAYTTTYSSVCFNGFAPLKDYYI